MKKAVIAIAIIVVPTIVTASIDVSLPHFENGKTLDAEQLNAVVDGIKANIHRLDELELPRIQPVQGLSVYQYNDRETMSSDLLNTDCGVYRVPVQDSTGQPYLLIDAEYTKPESTHVTLDGLEFNVRDYYRGTVNNMILTNDYQNTSIQYEICGVGFQINMIDNTIANVDEIIGSIQKVEL